MQVKEEDAVLYHVDKVRRPIPEDKAINKAVEMIRVYPESCDASEPSRCLKACCDLIDLHAVLSNLISKIMTVVGNTQEARHPILVIGAGANRKMTSNMLRQFVDATGIPFCHTQMGKGVIDERTCSFCSVNS